MMASSAVCLLIAATCVPAGKEFDFNKHTRRESINILMRLVCNFRLRTAPHAYI